MCTVTLVPKGQQDFILTSNRDEAPNRVSLPPESYQVNDTLVLFPKDKLSGGTWIGISEVNRVVCVLNGGFERHKRQPNYRKSRGVVAKDFLIYKKFEPFVEIYDFKYIEPFTMVIADWNESLKFYELIWDGAVKHFTKLPLEPKIWSSATLYNEIMKNERFHWFEDFKAKQVLNKETLLDFHKNTEANNSDYGVVMDRGFVRTTSITQIDKQSDTVTMRYENLLSHSVTSKTLNLSQTING
ncbi:NRDE family protein [Aestuariivivens sp. NBU2969]|uniref:NRDE family protein n=1 Tax=Aestuariivivens sp. NBU2969 TaxID=2873267 RepID=UPI001CC1227B|nr:NRDE family protein [Aestuariivivens sp. NBU2969]